MDINIIMDITDVTRAIVLNIREKLKDGRDLSHKSRGSPANRKLTPDKLDMPKTKFENSPTTSFRKMAKEESMDEKTVRNGLKKMGVASTVRPHCHLLTPKKKEKKTLLLVKKKLINWLKSNSSTVKIFSDKKLFIVDQPYNRRNDRWVGLPGAEVVPVMRTKHP